METRPCSHGPHCTLFLTVKEAQRATEDSPRGPHDPSLSGPQELLNAAQDNQIRPPGGAKTVLGDPENGPESHIRPQGGPAGPQDGPNRPATS
eukprot:5521154-Pyramimonas_sp.AAC.1